jgi:hypothetical protein
LEFEEGGFEIRLAAFFDFEMGDDADGHVVSP